MRPLIYVAGPISKGPMFHNIRDALEMADRLWEKGWLPFLPQLSFFWNLIIPHNPDGVHMQNGQLHFWMDYDFNVIHHCAAMFRLPGVSVGADMEEALAGKLQIPVYKDIAQVPCVGPNRV